MQKFLGNILSNQGWNGKYFITTAWFEKLAFLLPKYRTKILTASLFYIENFPHLDAVISAPVKFSLFQAVHYVLFSLTHFLSSLLFH